MKTMKTTDYAEATDKEATPSRHPVRTARSVWSAVTCHRFCEATCLAERRTACLHWQPGALHALAG